MEAFRHFSVSTFAKKFNLLVLRHFCFAEPDGILFLFGDLVVEPKELSSSFVLELIWVFELIVNLKMQTLIVIEVL